MCSQILGNNECFEPYTSNIYVRRVLSGEFTVVNQHLLMDLTRLGLWNPDLKNELVAANGSVQVCSQHLQLEALQMAAAWRRIRSDQHVYCQAAAAAVKVHECPRVADCCSLAHTVLQDTRLAWASADSRCWSCRVDRLQCALQLHLVALESRVGPCRPCCIGTKVHADPVHCSAWSSSPQTVAVLHDVCVTDSVPMTAAMLLPCCAHNLKCLFLRTLQHLVAELIWHLQELDIPDSLKALYKTVWEIKQRVLVDMAADRGAFIDQSQSFNVHMSDPNFGKLTSLHFHAWRVGPPSNLQHTGQAPVVSLLPGSTAPAGSLLCFHAVLWALLCAHGLPWCAAAMLADWVCTQPAGLSRHSPLAS